MLKPPPHASLRLPGRSMVSLNASLDRISSLSDWAFGKDPLVPTDSPRIPPSPGGASIDFNELGLLGEDLLPMGDEMARLHRFLCRSLAAASTSSPPPRESDAVMLSRPRPIRGSLRSPQPAPGTARRFRPRRL